MAMNYHELIVHDGKTKLHYAAEANDISMTQLLINTNHDIDIVDNQGNSPLMLAVEKKSYDTAILLVKAGANIYYLGSAWVDLRILLDQPINKSEYLVLSKYCEFGIVMLEKLKESCRNNEQLLLRRLRDFGFSLFQVCFSDANVTRLMLQNGHSVDERDMESNKTALHVAVTVGDFENVKVLLEFGASVKALDKSQNPPLYYLYDFMSELSADDEERVKILKILIKHGALSVPDGIGRSPVEFICEDGQSRAITTLIQYNVDFNDYHILSLLLANDRIDAQEVFRGQNIDVNVQVARHLPLLSISVFSYGWKKMQFLLERGADPNAVDRFGRTTLTIAITEISTSEPGDAALAKVRLLLQHGADVQYVVDGERTVFDLENIDGEVISPSTFESILAHLAIIDSTSDIGITYLIRSKIYSKEIFETHFERCKQQLETMKDTTIHESVTIFKLLTESHLKVTRYAGNPEFALKFKEAMESRKFVDQYYSITLHRRVGKAIHEAKLKEKAVVELMNNIFQCRFRNYRIIFDKILDYLTLDDLKNICKVYDLQESDSFNLDTIFV